MNGLTFGPDIARPWLARLDSRLKLAAVFGMSVVVVCVDDIRALAGCCAVAVLWSSGLQLRSRGWLSIVGVLAVIVWSAMLSQGFFYVGEPRTVLLTFIPPSGEGDGYFAGIVLTQEGLAYGAVQSLRFVAAALVGLTASLSTGPERMLAALAWFRVPTALAFMTATALRFLPLLVEEVSFVRQARRYRGHRFRWYKLPQEIGFLLPVIAGALRKAETLAESVTARGFDPRRPRTQYPPQLMRGWERLAMAAVGTLCVVLIAWRTWEACVYWRSTWS